MVRHDSRDLDGVIDAVARAMTSGGLTRDLRPAVASRLAAAPSWTFAWRLGLAAAAVAAVALVSVLTRPGSEPRHVPSSSVAGSPDTVLAPRDVPSRAEPAATDVMAAVAEPQTPRAVMRQTTDDRPPADDAVAIIPLAIEPIEADPLALSQVQIAPIDLEPVSIGELELVE
jgi:hypothetical protein